MDANEIFDSTLHFPGTAVLYGASQAGKSSLVLDLVQHLDNVFGGVKIERVIYVYTSYQEKFDRFKEINDKIEFVSNYKDIPEGIRNAIIIYDDHQLVFQCNATARLHITDIFQRLAHHNNLFSFCILQTIHNNKLRSLALNSTYQFYFPSVRDSLQVTFLNREYFPQPEHFLLEGVRDILKKSHGYLMIDCSRKSLEKFRVSKFVYPSIDSKLYIPEQ
jgi:hypothetical protein